MIHYLKGDATKPVGDGEKVIVHICNNRSAWGAGFVIALSNKWPITKSTYLNWGNPNLGMVQKIKVEENITVVNMVAQNGTISKGNPTPIRYGSLELCLTKVAFNLPPSTTIHMPRIGCGLAGGNWDQVEKIVNKVFKFNIVYIYDLI